MAIKTIKMAAVAASVFAAVSANATTLTLSTSNTVSVEGTTATNGVDIDAKELHLIPTIGFGDGDVLIFTLSGGEWKNRDNLVLVASDGSANEIDVTRFNNNEKNEVQFRLNEGLPLASHSVAAFGGKQGVFLYDKSGSDLRTASWTLKNAVSDTVYSLNYRAQTNTDKVIDSLTSARGIVSAVKQIEMSVSKNFDAEIDLVSDRKNFTGSTTAAKTTDTLEFAIKQHNATYGAIVAGPNDVIDIEVKGNDMSGITNLVLSSKTLTPSANSVTFEDLSYSDALTSATLVVTATIDGTTELGAKTFTTTAKVKLDEESDSTELNDASAGFWTINQLEAVVSKMSLNVSGFASWLTVTNDSAVSGDITAIATWSNGEESDQTESFTLGNTAAKSVSVISEATILEKIGKADAEGTVNVSLKLSIAAPKDNVYVVSEVKSTDGRLTTPVFYKGNREFN